MSDCGPQPFGLSTAQESKRMFNVAGGADEPVDFGFALGNAAF
jgi:hypothetical protein